MLINEFLEQILFETQKVTTDEFLQNLYNLLMTEIIFGISVGFAALVFNIGLFLGLLLRRNRKNSKIEIQLEPTSSQLQAGNRCQADQPK